MNRLYESSPGAARTAKVLFSFWSEIPIYYASNKMNMANLAIVIGTTRRELADACGSETNCAAVDEQHRTFCGHASIQSKQRCARHCSRKACRRSSSITPLCSKRLQWREPQTNPPTCSFASLEWVEHASLLPRSSQSMARWIIMDGWMDLETAHIGRLVHHSLIPSLACSIHCVQIQTSRRLLIIEMLGCVSSARRGAHCTNRAKKPNKQTTGRKGEVARADDDHDEQHQTLQHQRFVLGFDLKDGSYDANDR